MLQNFLYNLEPWCVMIAKIKMRKICHFKPVIFYTSDKCFIVMQSGDLMVRSDCQFYLHVFILFIQYL